MTVLQKAIVILAIVTLPAVSHAKITIASAAGYRSVVNALTATYEKETGNHIDLAYGNMTQVTFQAKVSGAIDMIIGERSYLKKEKLALATTETLGKGRLVAIYREGISNTTESHLFSEKTQRIAMPDNSRTIYGKAALQYMKETGNYKRLESNLFIVSTIPQAASYVISKEVDLAFVNLTHALNIQENIGGYILLDETKYSPIEIIIGQLEDTKNKEECQSFLKFLRSKKSQRIVTQYGM